jgi:hypothetical protein
MPIIEVDYVTKEIVTARADDIITKWIDFFVLHKPIEPERINGRLK